MKFLAQILTEVTGKPRQQVKAGLDFEWSNELWVHNIFRIYELIFWRRYGVRPSVAANKSGQIAFDFEAQCALFEVYIRGLFKKLKPRIVVIPQLQLAAYGASFGFTPYRFAVAYDAATAAGSPPKVSAFTWTHTITGSNPTITLGGGTNAAGTTSPTAKYDGNSLTTGTITQNTTSWGFVFYGTSPATGAKTAETDDSVLTEWAVNSISLTGTASSPSSPGTSGGKATSTSPSVTVATTAANSFVVTHCWCTNGTFGTTTTGTNQTSRSTSQDLDSGFSAGASTQTTTTTGNYTSGWTITSALWIISAIEVQPSAAVTTVSLLSVLNAG